jgi:hypothetical protein
MRRLANSGEEEDVQALEEHGVHREVVAGQDRLAVGLQEAAPGESGSSRCGWDAMATKQVADAGVETRWPSLSSSPRMRT